MERRDALVGERDDGGKIAWEVGCLKVNLNLKNNVSLKGGVIESISF